MTEPSPPVPESIDDSAESVTPGEVGEPPAGDDPAAGDASTMERQTAGADQASTGGKYDGYQRL